MNLSRINAAIFLAAFLAPSVSAQSVGGDADYIFYRKATPNITLFRVSGPGNVNIEVFSRDYKASSPLPDGQYSFEVWEERTTRQAPPVATAENYKSTLNNGRPRKNGQQQGRLAGFVEVLRESGSFVISDGVVVIDAGQKER